GIFAVVLEVTAVANITREIHSACEHDIETTAARFQGYRYTAIEGELRVKTRTYYDRCWKRGSAAIIRTIAGIGDTHARVTALQRWYAKTRNTGRIACAHVFYIFGDPWVMRICLIRAKKTCDQREPFIVRHFLFCCDGTCIRRSVLCQDTMHT